ncbi:MAG: hypothetical protein IJA19_05710 [Clostridia bacterium]|nr:hypothetical protein [Clostridia bacterium]
MTFEELQSVKQMFADRDSASDLWSLFKNFTNEHYSNRRVALVEGDNHQPYVVYQIPEKLLADILGCIKSYEEELQNQLDRITVNNIPALYQED